MTKYKAFGLTLGFQVFTTYVVNAIGDTTTDVIQEPSEVVFDDGIVFIWDIVKGMLRTFWDIMTFQIPTLPYWISMLMYISSFIMFLLIISLIRGTD